MNQIQIAFTCIPRFWTVFQKILTIRLRLYEALLEGAMLGGQMAAVELELLCLKNSFSCTQFWKWVSGADPSALRRFAPLFVEAVERWRARAKDICEGRDTGARETGAIRAECQLPAVSQASASSRYKLIRSLFRYNSSRQSKVV